MRLGQLPRARLTSTAASSVADPVARHDRQPVVSVDVQGGHVIGRGGGAREAERPPDVAALVACGRGHVISCFACRNVAVACKVFRSPWRVRAAGLVVIDVPERVCWIQRGIFDKNR